MNYETCKEIELAVAKWFGVRRYVMVPNVSWGLLPYEADILALTKSGYLWEIEIKVSRSDLLRDGKKRHQHDSYKVRQLWFAIPEKLENCAEYIPQRAGIFVVGVAGNVIERRQPTANPAARKLSDVERFQFARLGALRVWSLKERLQKVTAAQQAREHAAVLERAP
jgi:hypothetical protein